MQHLSLEADKVTPDLKLLFYWCHHASCYFTNINIRLDIIQGHPMTFIFIFTTMHTTKFKKQCFPFDASSYLK